MGVRITMTKAQSATSTGAGLLGLLGEITEDGRISDEEVQRLRDWLSQARTATLPESDLPAVGFLADIVERILLDGRVDLHERRALLEGIERVMPKSIREQAQAAKAATDEAELLRHRFGFPVVGINYEGRIELMEDNGVEDGTSVFLRRDHANQFSRNAVCVLLKNGTCIGMVPEERSDQRIAKEVAELLEQGMHQLAFVEHMAGPCPIVVAYFFDPDTPRADAVAPSRLPSPNGRGLSNRDAGQAQRSAAPAQRLAVEVPEALPDPVEEPVALPRSRWPLLLLGLALGAVAVFFGMR